ncbi:hypothetical protein UFOVP181_205 [uncultured Caudovirales phage]|uniref:Lipoprotein n=1 Tax=uncultured Caudovirales phage TaxID=2100421 RepID=A0A6J5KYN9_9CAUD|nr:hypothetical protein UFOVP57_434 [uncultured Caudovirales phage]CAB5208832.1 hypothetical protein UFOVP181_205 [uncultured Caudovirales phage]
MKYYLVLLVLILTACGDAGSVMSYEQLVNYPSSCDKKEAQLKELTQLQRSKNFPQDPDDLNESDRAYNSRLKATIWWYEWKCQ